MTCLCDLFLFIDCAIHYIISFEIFFNIHNILIPKIQNLIQYKPGNFA